MSSRYGKTLWSHIVLVRPGNVVTMFVGAIVGAVVEGGLSVLQNWDQAQLIVLAGVSVASIGAGANALNDYYDANVDTVNRPERPIPVGDVETRGALLVFFVLSLIGLVIGFQISVLHGAIAATSILLLAMYNRFLKRTGLLGNFVVALLTSAAILFGGLVVGGGKFAAVGACFAFLLTLAREVCKDVEDLEGDKLIGSQSLAVTRGSTVALSSSSGIVILAVLLLPAPFLFSDFGGLYMVAIIPAAFAMLSAISRMQEWDGTRSASQLLKGSMILGMMALVLGRYNG